jgi:hypothetical protein
MTSMAAFRLHLPRDLEFDKVRAFVRSLSSIGGLRPPAFGLRPKVVFELHVDANGASYYLLLPETAAQAEVGLLAASVPGVVAEPVDVPTIDGGGAAELRLTRSDRALRTDQPANLISPLLAGLTPAPARSSGSWCWCRCLIGTGCARSTVSARTGQPVRAACRPPTP